MSKIKNQELLPPKNDVVFKALFSRGKPRITQAMLEAILKLRNHRQHGEYERVKLRILY